MPYPVYIPTAFRDDVILEVLRANGGVLTYDGLTERASQLILRRKGLEAGQLSFGQVRQRITFLHRHGMLTQVKYRIDSDGPGNKYAYGRLVVDGSFALQIESLYKDPYKTFLAIQQEMKVPRTKERLMNLRNVRSENMVAARTDLLRWFKDGASAGHTHMLVITDTYDHDDYPVYAKDDDECLKKYDEYRGKDMQRVTEVYDLRKSMLEQMERGRVFELPGYTTADRERDRNDSSVGVQADG